MLPEILSDKQLMVAIGAALADDPATPRVAGQSVLAALANTVGPTPSASRSRYQLRDVIGRGGIGTVWRAYDQDLDREVAFKVLRQEFEISPAAVRRFVAESQIAGRLQHAGILPVYELGLYPDGRVYLVMKIVTGQTLAQLLQAKTTESAKLLSLFTSVCQTVSYAHSQGVIHRDLKPSNIMVSEFNEVFVMDWGLAKDIRITNQSVTNSRHDHETASDTKPSLGFQPETQVGTVLGTFGYIAPEHETGRAIDWNEQDDVFSLGVIAYELLTGQRLVTVNDSVGRTPLTPELLSDALVRFDQCVEEPQLRQLIRHCLAFDRQQRWPNASAIATALVDYQAELQSRLTEANLLYRTTELRLEAERRRRRLWFALLSTIGISFAIVATIWIQKRLETVAREATQLQREKENVHEIAGLLTEADQLLGNGQREKAELLVRKAEGLAKLTSPAHLVTVLERVADVRMLEALETIRLKRTAAVSKPIIISSPRPDRAGFLHDRESAYYYAQAFREYGVDVEGLANDDVVAFLHSRNIRFALARALDGWATNTADVATQSRLRLIAEAVESQPASISCRIRNALSSGNPQELTKIAAETPINESPEVHFLVGRALRNQGDFDSAGRFLTRAVTQYPSDFWLNLELGAVHALQTPNDPNPSRPWIATAFALSQGNADVYTYLGIAQTSHNLFVDAETTFRRAMQVNPQLPGGRLRLAYVLSLQKKFAESRQVIQDLIVAEPTNAVAYFNLGILQQLQPNTVLGAIDSYRKAAELDPDLPEVWNNLGNAYTSLRRYEEATSAFETALKVRPNYGRVMFNQGVLFDNQRRYTDAMKAYRRAIETQPDFVEASYNLAYDLTYEDGRFQEARTVLEKSLPSIPAGDVARGRWQRLMDECDLKAKQDARLTELLQSAGEPATAQEAIDLAVLAAWPRRQLFVTATRFSERAFSQQPMLANDLVQGYRYFAAGCAVRAACGQGSEAKGINMEDRNRLHALALGWLQADLAIRRTQLEPSDAKQRADVKSKLRYWLSDPNLSGVRASKDVALLPEAERGSWESFWKAVQELAK